ncbi:hypothetical protein, partial [Paenibacillus sp. Soil766]|uniref:hypothetical protein n=1 Tax=Paenibacillus sp. Soil766 TaxID=1736404 RepID=UPI001F410D2D
IAHLKLARFCNLFYSRLLDCAYSLVVQFSKINYFLINPPPLKGDLINIPHQPIRLQELFLISFVLSFDRRSDKK